MLPAGDVYQLDMGYALVANHILAMLLMLPVGSVYHLDWYMHFGQIKIIHGLTNQSPPSLKQLNANIQMPLNL